MLAQLRFTKESARKPICGASVRPRRAARRGPARDLRRRRAGAQPQREPRTRPGAQFLDPDVARPRNERLEDGCRVEPPVVVRPEIDHDAARADGSNRDAVPSHGGGRLLSPQAWS